MRRIVIVAAAAAACSAPSETAETVAAACDFSAPGSRDASWSPDGTSLVFDTNRDGNQEIYVMDADGSNARRLTQTEDSEYYPFYSPDGSRLTFMTADAEGITRVSVMNADGSDLTHLTPAGVTNTDPTWSPDGNRIAFYSDQHDEEAEIYVMDADGENWTRLTDTEGLNQTPSFSPDGSRIAFISTRDGNAEVYVMNADGSNQTRLTDDARADRVARWSPTGAPIVFYRRPTLDASGDRLDRDVSWSAAEIWSVEPDGSGLTQITDNAHLDQSPELSPDGAKIAYTSCASGAREVWVMNADGSDPRRLTHTGG